MRTIRNRVRFAAGLVNAPILLRPSCQYGHALRSLRNASMRRHATDDPRSGVPMMATMARRVVLASRPAGEPQANNFRMEDHAIPQPGAGEVLLRTLWLSLDPYMRGRMSDAPSYATPVQIGQVMEGRAISEVAASNVEGFAKGDLV